MIFWLTHSFHFIYMSDHHLVKGLSLSSFHDSGIHSLLIPEIRLLHQYSVPSSKHTSSKLLPLPRFSPFSLTVYPDFDSCYSYTLCPIEWHLVLNTVICYYINTSWVVRRCPGIYNVELLYVCPAPGTPQNCLTPLRPVPGCHWRICEISALYLENCANACWIFHSQASWSTVESSTHPRPVRQSPWPV